MKPFPETSTRRAIRGIAERLSKACHLLGRFRGDRRGATVMMTAFASTAVLGFMAIGIDGTHFYLVRNRLQTATDLAALAAISGSASASSLAGSAMAANGFSGVPLSVTPGLYRADPTVPPAARFTAGVDGNAIEVIAAKQENFIFGKAFRILAGSARAADGSAEQNGVPIRTRAVAQRQDMASFTLGSSLVNFDGGLINAVLGGLLGAHLSFSALDYESLGNASFDLFDLCDRLKIRGSVTGPTYGSAATTVVGQSDLLNTMADSLQQGGASASILRSIARLLPPGAVVDLSDLIDFGPASGLRIGSPHPMSARVSALDMLKAVAQLGGVNHIVDVDLSGNAPGLVSAHLRMTVGERMVGSHFFMIGAVSTTLHTAQVRLQLTVTILTVPGLPQLTIPFYLEIAPATATLSAIACPAGAANASVSLDVKPGVGDLWLGDVQPGDFGSFLGEPVVNPAKIGSSPFVGVLTAIGHNNVDLALIFPVSFGSGDISSDIKKTVSSTLSFGAWLGSLIGNTKITVVTPVVTLRTSNVAQKVGSAITQSLAPVEKLFSDVMALLGLTVGRATSTVSGVRCGHGVLVE